MKIKKNTLAIALVIGTIGFSSCSRVYSSRNFVKSNQEVKTKEIKEENTTASKKTPGVQIQPQSITAPLELKAESFAPTLLQFEEKKQVTVQTVRIENERNGGEILTAKLSQSSRKAKQEFKATAKQAPTQKKKNAGGSKSQLTALILCFFFGMIGVHRFYLGYPVIGIIQILTLGGFGIWALIDLILIITGDLQPKNGSYDKTFDDL